MTKIVFIYPPERRRVSTMYLNEHDAFAAEWLGNLYPDATIDTRSIADVLPADVAGFRRVHLFAGIGGWEYALQLAGWPEDAEVWTGSCPCQPYSLAGKRKGDDDHRNLWPEMFRLIRECRPATIFFEQVASAIGHGWLDGVSDDLERENYAVGAAVLPACSVKSPHKRNRLFGVAYRSDTECGRWQESEREQRQPLHASNSGRANPLGDVFSAGLEGRESQPGDNEPQQPPTERTNGDAWADYHIVQCLDGKARRVGSRVQPLAYGIPRHMGRGQPELRGMVRRARSNRTGRLRGYGNAIVPQVAAVFIQAMFDRLAAGG